MSNPVRKRKRGDPGDPPRTFRSIDSFFKSPRKQPHEADCRIPKSPSEHQLLTDEELARKLQAEWDNDASSNFRNATPTNSDENQAPPSQDMKASDGQDPAPPKSCVFASSKKKKSVLSLQTSTSAEDTISMSLPLDQPPLTFSPSLYLDKLREFWNTEGGHASYSILARAFSLVNSTQSRIRIVDILVNLLRILIEGDPDSLLPAVWLATNAFAPPYVPLELGLGGSAISKALKKAYGLDNLGLKTLYDKYGDAGDVAYEAKKKQSFTLRRPKPLSIKGVYDSLMKIANSKGTGSQENKQRLVEQLLRDARGAEESRYIVRTLVQHLRIGAGADDREIRNVISTGISEAVLAKCGLALHVPLLPMLGSITRDLTEMLTKLQGRKFSCEYKYDGQRAQVHCDSSGKVSLFSRHLELMTDKYPDLVSLVPQIRGDGVSSFILEGEVVAVDQESGVLLPFQTLSNRAKKNVEIGDIKINGRKAQWWSPILLAVRNPETGSLEAVTKCMSGFTDKFYQENKEKYAENGNNTIPRPSYVEYRNEPEVWFEPQEVWEIAFADITLSPTYTAAIGMASEERGLSLRFPRFLRVREDKTIEEASTSSTLAELWKKQMARLQSEGADLPQEEENG
ncbi:DNA ligase 1 [Coccidioides immitis H538.4]|uniref:DNA ligase 1 n=1 Tax=Coccidioides immitis H538.4 TaxID=396776 RepID=A0A0J8RKA2_COCIT|nr:DNA ligase 1 [Coccidioides immitis H538.4]